MYNQSLPSFIVDDPYQTGFGTTDGRAASPITGDRNIDAPQTHEQLIAHNSSLKTRVNELELINELIRGRLGQLEQQEASRGPESNGIEHAQLKSQVDALQEREAHLSAQLDDSHRRENSLKRRLDELELELKEAETAKEAALKELNGIREVTEINDVVDMKETKEVEDIVEPVESLVQNIETIQHDEEVADEEPPAKRPRLEEEAPVEETPVEEANDIVPAVEVS
jgi:GATA-binding protein